MARPLRIAYPGAFYYITSLGNENERKDIFKSLTSTSSVNDQVIPPEADLRLFQGRYKAILAVGQILRLADCIT